MIMLEDIRNLTKNERYIQHSVMYFVDAGYSESRLLKEIYEDWSWYKLNEEIHPLSELKKAIESLIDQGRLQREERMIYWIRNDENIEIYNRDSKWIQKNELRDFMKSTDHYTEATCRECGEIQIGDFGGTTSLRKCSNCLSKEER